MGHSSRMGRALKELKKKACHPTSATLVSTVPTILFADELTPGLFAYHSESLMPSDARESG
eukprot:578398-Amphidinium_carterae.2